MGTGLRCAPRTRVAYDTNSCLYGVLLHHHVMSSRHLTSHNGITWAKGHKSLMQEVREYTLIPKRTILE